MSVSLFSCASCRRLPEAGGVCRECGSLWQPDELGTLQRVEDAPVTDVFEAWSELNDAIVKLLGRSPEPKGEQIKLFRDVFFGARRMRHALAALTGDE